MFQDVQSPADDRDVADRIDSDAEAIRIATALAEDFAKGAAERDRTRRLPAAEIERFSASGLWAIGVPRRFGGLGASFRTITKVIEIISAADPSIGQIPQNHFSVAFLLQSVGREEQQRHFLDLILRGARFGNALAELTRKTAHDFETRFTRSRRDGVDGWEINGRKFYSTGALFADFVSVGASDTERRRLTAIVPRNAPGLTVVDDWSSFGQRTTASGTVTLDCVFASDLEVIETWRTLDRPVANGPVAQIIQAAIDSGIAVAAVEDTKALVRDVARRRRRARRRRAVHPGDGRPAGDRAARRTGDAGTRRRRGGPRDRGAERGRRCRGVRRGGGSQGAHHRDRARGEQQAVRARRDPCHA